MSTLCIQVHANRAPGIDMARVRALGQGVASDSGFVSRFAVVEGDDEGPFTNLMFETAELNTVWSLLQDALYQDEEVGPALSQASMAMCEGREGWSDYLLLYHFDSSVRLDSVEAR